MNDIDYTEVDAADGVSLKIIPKIFTKIVIT